MISRRPSFEMSSTANSSTRTSSTSLSDLDLESPSSHQFTGFIPERPSRPRAATWNNTHSTLPMTESTAMPIEEKVVIIMVGLPARGKSYITNKLSRYLNWLQIESKVFNVGNTRRKRTKAADEKVATVNSNGHNNTIHSASFFDHTNTKSKQAREQWAMETLDELLEYLLDGEGSVGIFDATNTTTARRRSVVKKIQQRSQNRLKILFVESICDDEKLIYENVKLKLSGPDYKDVDPDIALNDFITRMKNYEKVYETLGEQDETQDVQYIKLINAGMKVVFFNIEGYVSEQIVGFMMNFNIEGKQIWITRSGETDSDTSLTAKGHQFAQATARFLNEKRAEYTNTSKIYEPREVNVVKNGHFGVWTSLTSRCVETAEHFDEHVFDIKHMRTLEPRTTPENMTFAALRDMFPAEYTNETFAKIQYKYQGRERGGPETYLDVIDRVRPVILEVERMADNTLIITHKSVCKALLNYFANPELGTKNFEVPLHTLYCMEPSAYGVTWKVYKYDDITDEFNQVEGPESSAFRPVNNRRFSLNL